MKFSKNILPKTSILKGALFALTVCGLAFPSTGNAQGSLAAESANRSGSNAVLADGTYLFGQSAEPDVAGSTYAVFSVKDNRTVGAFYQPRSSFDCFSGEISPNQMAVNVVDSYTQTVHPYAVAVALNDSLVAGEAAGAYTLEGFSPIDTLSAQDYEILEVCQADFAQ